MRFSCQLGSILASFSPSWGVLGGSGGLLHRLGRVLATTWALLRKRRQKNKQQGGHKVASGGALGPLGRGLGPSWLKKTTPRHPPTGWLTDQVSPETPSQRFVNSRLNSQRTVVFISPACRILFYGFHESPRKILKNMRSNT